MADECHAAAQAFERIFIDVDAANQDLAFIRIEEAWQHIGQGGFAATRCANQGSHFALRYKQVNVVQAVTFGFRIAVYNIAKFDIVRVWAEDLFAFVAFFGLIQKCEDTFCRRQTALQGLHHAGHAFDGVKHHDHAGQKRHKITCAKA